MLKCFVDVGFSLRSCRIRHYIFRRKKLTAPSNKFPIAVCNMKATEEVVVCPRNNRKPHLYLNTLCSCFNFAFILIHNRHRKSFQVKK